MTLSTWLLCQTSYLFGVKDEIISPLWLAHWHSAYCVRIMPAGESLLTMLRLMSKTADSLSPHYRLLCFIHDTRGKNGREKKNKTFPLAAKVGSCQVTSDLKTQFVLFIYLFVCLFICCCCPTFFGIACVSFFLSASPTVAAGRVRMLPDQSVVNPLQVVENVVVTGYQWSALLSSRIQFRSNFCRLKGIIRERERERYG